MANVKGLVFACYLSARHRPSQVTATPQPICVITTAFSHFPDNVLHPHTPIRPPSLSLSLSLSTPPPSLAFQNSPHSLFSSVLSPSFILLLTLLYFCNPPSPIHYFILLLNLFLHYLIPLPVLITLPFSSCSCYASPLSPLYPSHSPALSSHQKVLDFDICLQEQ